LKYGHSLVACTRFKAKSQGVKQVLRKVCLAGWVLGCWTLCLAPASYGARPYHFAAADIRCPDFFPILPWDPYHGWDKPGRNHPLNGLESIAQCNFNMAGFVLPRDLRQCEKLRLGALLLPTDAGCTNFSFFREWENLSDAQVDERVRWLVRSGRHSPAVVGYFLTDEPGVREFAGLARAVAAVKRYAPGKLAYINLFPDYATLGAPDRSQLGTSNYTEYLERFVSEVKPQALSYDNYMVEYSDDLREPNKAADYYRNLLEVRRVAQEHGLPCLNIVSAGQIRPRTPPPSPANLQFQAFTTLAAGYRGVTWYNYYGPGYRYTAIDPQDHKTPTWLYLREVNAQVKALAPVLSRLHSTGVYFSKPLPAPGLPQLPGTLVESVLAPTPIMVGEFRAPEGRGYVMLVNLSLERSTRVTLTLRAPVSRIRLVSAADGSRSDHEEEQGLWLTPGQGLLFRLLSP
jgi:hypothetical protein